MNQIPSITGRAVWVLIKSNHTYEEWDVLNVYESEKEALEFTEIHPLPEKSSWRYEVLEYFII